MIDVTEALSRVMAAARGAARAREVCKTPLAEALGMVLAEDVASDVDSPPHDRAIVDGYAVRSADFVRRPTSDTVEPVELEVIEEVTAGDVPSATVGSGQATRIMTGAPVPEGADAVVMVEETEAFAEPHTPLGGVRFQVQRVAEGQNIMPRATSMRRGQVVLSAGAMLGSAQIGLLAEVGRAGVSVYSRPRVAVLATGNELVAAEFVPGPGQIRNSNGPMLVAATREAGGVPLDLGIGRDEKDALRELVDQGLGCDVLVLSGGVSAGTKDFVPEVLAEAGVEEVFHKIRLKPGKPLWFGVRRGEERSTLVFGLPGNPVSSFVCFQLFVHPALAALAGAEPPNRRVKARLVDAFTHRGPRPTYHPARLQFDNDEAMVDLVSWRGSGDLRALANIDSLAVFPEGEHAYSAGDEITVLQL